jgi:hypothetical protein
VLRRFATTGRKHREARVVDLCDVVAVAVVGDALLDLVVGQGGPSGSRHPAESIEKDDFRQPIMLTVGTLIIGT